LDQPPAGRAAITRRAASTLSCPGASIASKGAWPGVSVLRLSGDKSLTGSAHSQGRKRA
jgi:hypothetical protein